MNKVFQVQPLPLMLSVIGVVIVLSVAFVLGTLVFLVIKSLPAWIGGAIAVVCCLWEVFNV